MQYKVGVDLVGEGYASWTTSGMKRSTVQYVRLSGSRITTHLLLLLSLGGFDRASLAGRRRICYYTKYESRLLLTEIIEKG